MSATVVPIARDNLFGVCAAIGDAFHIHPNILRLAFALSLLIDLRVPLAIYITGAVIVLAAEGIARLTVRGGGGHLVAI